MRCSPQTIRFFSPPTDFVSVPRGLLHFGTDDKVVQKTARHLGKPGGEMYRASSRRGVSLPMVLIAVSMSLMMTYAAMNSQSRGMQVLQNVNRQELAHHAAESGAAIALAKMQASDWAGTSTPLSGTLESDSSGTTTYSVQFLTIDGQSTPSAYSSSGGQTSLATGSNIFSTSASGLSSSSVTTAMTATKQAFQLLIRSTGQWQSATSTTDLVTDIVEVGMELQPRVPGRVIQSGDSASATDVMANSNSYDTIQNYALFATAGSSGSPSLTIEPGQRIDGPIWLSRGVEIFYGPKWGSSTRNDFLQSTGTLYSATSGGLTVLSHPHPFGGTLTTYTALTSSEVTDVTKLNVPRQQASSVPTAPTVSFSNWQHYQLFQGGFTYDAETLISSSLSNVILRPTPRNPLGIFYFAGNLQIGDNVVIQGTLVCTSQVRFTGNNSVVASLNWRDAAGATLLSSADLFPRLPAIACQNLDFDANVRVTIEGAVLSTGTVTNSASDYDLISAADVNMSGTQATTAPLRQPYSQVQLPANTNLSSVLGSGQHAVWLADGTTGNWYPIVDVDNTNKRLTVLGEAKRPGPVSFQIRRQRLRNIALRGPLMTSRLQLTPGNSWKMGTGLWNGRYSIWQLLISTQLLNNLPLTPFVTWVGSPSSYPGWGAPYETVGLPLEPTFHLRPLTGVTYRDSLPMFRSYVPPSTGSYSMSMMASTVDLSGYRWRLLFWRNP